MQITRFCPSIISPKAADVIATLEALGFERRHKKEGINDKNVTSVTMNMSSGDRSAAFIFGSCESETVFCADFLAAACFETTFFFCCAIFSRFPPW